MKARDTGPRTDALGDVLRDLGLRGVSYWSGELTEPWGIEVPGIDGGIVLHIVTEGRCWLEVERLRSQLLRPGDVALVTHGRVHRLTSEPGRPGLHLAEVPREAMSDRYSTLTLDGGGQELSMLSAALRLEHPAAQLLYRLLPDVINVQPDNDVTRAMLRMLGSELREARPGGETAITSLADLLALQALRLWIEENRSVTRGWLSALRDERIGLAMALIHREPEHPWTVGLLAVEAGMSRSAFSARFTELAGEAPLHYLTRWRMYVAAAQLYNGKAPVGEVGRRLGYRSDAAFNRAFKRYIGRPPGAIRRRDEEPDTG